MITLTLIAAVAKNRVIGIDNRLPWHLPEDMRHFREITLGKPVIMGRKTWESLPEAFRPLPGRKNIVISRQADYAAPGATLVNGLPAALERVEGETFIIGGEQLYALALPYADRLALTEVDMEVSGDAWFPAFSNHEWQEVQRDNQVSEKGIAFAFVTYQRRRANA